MSNEQSKSENKELTKASNMISGANPDEGVSPVYADIGEVGDCGSGKPTFQTLLGMPMLCVEGEPDLKLFCPRCRATINWQDPCRHIMFVYDPEGQEFDCVAPHAKAAIDMLLARIKTSEDEDGNTDLDPLQELVKYWRSTTAFCLQITYEGIACGPVSDFIYVGIELCPPGERAEDD